MKQLFTITRDAMLASTLNHLTSICIGDEIEETKGYISMAITLKALKPQTIETEEDRSTALLVAYLAKITEDMELEAEMLEILQTKISAEEFKMLSKLSFSHRVKDESFLYAVGKFLIPLLKLAGLEDLETSFAELDSLGVEAGAGK